MIVYDKATVEMVESWGSDEAIIRAARMSTQNGFRGWGTEEKPGDEKLLAYLYKNKHMTPFEMAGAVFEIQAPIFVFREWHRHRTQSYNEASARYAPLPDLNYMPSVERVLLGAAADPTSRQAAAMTGQGPVVDPAVVVEWRDELDSFYAHAQALYLSGLQRGIPKELARLVLPMGRYSKMRASANLRNWMGFLTLRQDEKAQWEIRELANEVAHQLAQQFPRAMALFAEDRHG